MTRILEGLAACVVVMVLIAPVGPGLGVPAEENKPASVNDSTPGDARNFAQPVRKATTGERPAPARSFFGAPPPIPHFLESDRDVKGCLACHAREDNIALNQQAISPTPHAIYSQCTQCHVDASGGGELEYVANDFVGLDRPGKGKRAYPTAPPTIPHKTFMRDNCQACHGIMGDHDIKTTHPERSQCGQCHVPEASQNYTRPVPWTRLQVEE